MTIRFFSSSWVFNPAFVKGLDFVMEQDGKLIGQNMFVKTVIDVDEFDKGFPLKEKLKLPGQILG